MGKAHTHTMLFRESAIQSVVEPTNRTTEPILYTDDFLIVG